MYKELLEISISKFIDWLREYGEVSYDRMDYWSSLLGVFTKRLFYKNKILGAPFAFLGIIQESFIPSLLKLYAKPRREAIGDAHYAIAFLNLYECCKDSRYFNKAEHYLNELIKSSISGYSGYCWGYTFGWETNDGFNPPHTPLITVTPYPFWAFKKAYELTNKKEYWEICHSIAEFALKDLKKTQMPNGTFCSSYGPDDDRYIINANTYRAALLLDIYSLTNKSKYKEEACSNIDFVLSYQGEKGEWYYEATGTRDRFIDNFHTAFVLRNLTKCYFILKDIKLLEAIMKGYKYYRENLFRSDNTPLHFSEIKYNKFRKYEMYDYAEGIKLGCLLKTIVPGALEFSKILANDLITKFQLKDGHFVTRVSNLNLKNKIPYHRWPQAQLFCSLTELLKEV